VQIENKELTFEMTDRDRIARAAVYGIVTSLGNRVVAEFDDELMSHYSGDQPLQGSLRESAYQKILVLEAGKRYKVVIVVKDLQSERVGFVERALVAPSFDAEQIAASSVVLARSLRVLDAAPAQDEMFVIGDVKIYPNLSQSFSPGQPLGLYFQLYNVTLDQGTFLPSLEVSFRLLRDGKVLRQLVDRDGKSVQYFSEQRVVLVQALGLEGLEAGRYLIRIQVKDQLSGQSLELNVPFSLEGESVAKVERTH
jgi:hypothetical protein